MVAVLFVYLSAENNILAQILSEILLNSPSTWKRFKKPLSQQLPLKMLLICVLAVD